MSGCQSCNSVGRSTAIENNFVGVRLGEESNLTLCVAGADIFCEGESVIIDFDPGPALGTVERSPIAVFKLCQKSRARRILRRATDSDQQAHSEQEEKEKDAKRFCQEQVRTLGLEMKVSKVSFALDGRSAAIHFTADGRIDFRQLVREVSQRFSARVRMVQVGARDEAGLLGGVGICGRTLCCSTWLNNFRPISIQMAKRQNLSLNPSKISGQCGRLLCCLAYEDDHYRPDPGSRKEKRSNG